MGTIWKDTFMLYFFAHCPLFGNYTRVAYKPKKGETARFEAKFNQVY